MALINRVSRLFKADFNAVLDHIEDPEQVLKQAVRDMEDELQAAERRIASCEQDQEALLARGNEIRESSSELEEQLDLCFESGKDELARNIVRRKLEAGRLMKRLDARLEGNQRFLDRERKQIEENRSVLEGMRQKAELFVNRTPESSFAGERWGGCPGDDASVHEDEVEIAYLREKSARSGS
jgi:phage shock protein A